MARARAADVAREGRVGVEDASVRGEGARDGVGVPSESLERGDGVERGRFARDGVIEGLERGARGRGGGSTRALADEVHEEAVDAAGRAPRGRARDARGEVGVARVEVEREKARRADGGGDMAPGRDASAPRGETTRRVERAPGVEDANPGSASAATIDVVSRARALARGGR